MNIDFLFKIINEEKVKNIIKAIDFIFKKLNKRYKPDEKIF